jgi:hypothetical protein
LRQNSPHLGEGRKQDLSRGLHHSGTGMAHLTGVAWSSLIGPVRSPPGNTWLSSSEMLVRLTFCPRGLRSSCVPADGASPTGRNGTGPRSNSLLALVEGVVWISIDASQRCVFYG